MTYNHSGRLWLIFAVLYTALSCIFPDAPPSLFWIVEPSKVSFKPALDPGIDMVGGTSLTYDIKQPEGGYHGDGTLAEGVASALKRRVDPLGQRNLIWRPQGNTRLEIQLPRQLDSVDATPIRTKYLAAQRDLEATNIREGDVLRAVEESTGADRDKKLADLAGSNETQLAFFKQLAAAYDVMTAAEKKGDNDLAARSLNAYDDLKKKISTGNVSVSEMQAILDGPAADRDKRLADVKKNASPKQVAAIDEFVKAQTEYNKVKDSLDSAADIKRLLRGSGVLEFHILVDQSNPQYAQMVERLQSEGPGIRAGDTMRWYEIDKPSSFGPGQVPYQNKSYVLGWTTPDKSMTNPPGQKNWSLESARQDHDENRGQAVGFLFDPSGARYFGRLTGANIGQQLAVVLDDRVFSAANINSQIFASGIITRRDGYTTDEMKYLINVLNAGSLPATLADEPISERTIGPQLGAENLRRGLLACVVGLGVVGLFLIFYYYLAGAVAAIAVVLNVVLILATMAATNATFTLPGVAGIVLTIGAAVDANVLIFERLREEQLRGVGLKAALRNAYSRAATAIFDSNATTLITAFILVWLGTEEVKGFGVTLLIGLVWSLFTSLYVTRTILDLLADKFGVQKFGSIPMSFPKWDHFLKPNVDWMGKAWMFMTFSALFIILGLVAIFAKFGTGELLDVEFTKGTSVQFKLVNKMGTEQVRSRIEASGLPSPSVVSVGDSGDTYEVITPAESVKDVISKVLDAMKDKDTGKSLLDIETPSSYGGVEKSFDQVLGTIVKPIGTDTITFDGFTPANTGAYRGGVAIGLTQISPRLTPDDITKRIRTQQLQPTAGGETPVYTDLTVVSPNGPTAPTDTAVVLVSPGNFPHDQDADRWRTTVAEPMWKVIADALHAPSQLQSVRSIDPSIADQTQLLALWAMILSVLVIMVYIWLRFGNLKYGTATVLAMLHDTLLAVGAIGLAHYMVQWTPWLANVLLVEPFRVNLTLVAGILTVMSYSMIDTIVVFDRIRENRGKLGHVSRQVVNDSINQTLSRTLLTVGTTVMTLLGMYIFGGSGIHGFTFVLLIGILVGTYSSIAIAAPFLLLGAGREAEKSGNRASVGQLQRA